MSGVLQTGAPTTMLAALEEAYGGRDAVLDQLAGLSDPRAQKVVALLTDPSWRGKSLADLCQAAEVPQSSMLMLLREGALARAVAQAHLRFQGQLPQVVDKVVEASLGGLVQCRCTIGGQKDALHDCPQCRGTGKMVVNPSLPHQELVLDVLGVTPKPGPLVQTQVNVQQSVAIGGIFDAFVKGSRGGPPSPAPRSSSSGETITVTPVALTE